MKSKFAILFLLLAKLGFSQIDAEEHRVYIKWAPLSLIDSWNGSNLKLGTEINNQVGNAIYFEFGTYFSRAGSYSHNKGFLARTEFKHYLGSEYDNCGPYVSLSLMYKQQSFHTADSIDLNPIYKKDFDVHKNVGCATINVGTMAPVNNIFNLEVFIGLGIRIKNATSTLSADENNHMKSSADYGPNLFADQAGHFVLPFIDIGMKFAFGISKKQKNKNAELSQVRHS
jgi:hypothetical protein